MRLNLTIAALLAGCSLACPAAALAAPAPNPAPATGTRLDHIPDQLDAAQRSGYRLVFAAIREGRWTDAQIALDSMAPGPLHAIARAELYTAKGSPRVELAPLVALLNEAPELPEAEQLRRLAQARGASDLPPLPVQQRLIWQDGAPRRVRTKPTASDQVAADLLARMQPFIKSDDGASAEALLIATSGLSSEAQTEWQARVAWMYYLQGNDEKARELGALAANGYGDWAVQGRWMGALAAWRQNDCHAAETGFENVAARANDVDLRAAGLYWAARADIVCARPDKVQARLTSAAQFRESFYGQLARQALGLRNQVKPGHGLVATEWSALERRPNIRVAAALVELGETELADDVIRQQARIGNPAEFASLVRLAETLDLPATTLWLAHNCPQGVTTLPEARYPTPNWTPDSGWRVDKSLVYAHALEESRFRSKVTSPAGAYGLMQIMPAAAVDFARERGLLIDKNALSRPSTNMDIGQRHLERLRDMMGITGGLLPKVIAAYNAGPKPVGEWNSLVHDNGDPLLYIESIPYWETRGYVTTVLRNYWMYEAQNGKPKSASRNALAQGMWPRFPGLSGATAVRMPSRNIGYATISRPVRPVPTAPAPVVMAAAAPASATAPSSAPSDTDALRAAAAAMAMQRPKASISFSAAEPGGVR
jgi:soluble lytic murein transglycosylase-like protein